jgi:Cd2+/Zn2+-exporting ATPase
MIGRFSHAHVYRDLLRSRDFVRLVIAGMLALASYLWGRGDASPTVAATLALASVALNGAPIVWGALRGLAQRKVNVDELVAIAIAACLLQGEFLTAAVVSFVMVLGALVEEATSDTARRAIQSLIRLSPESATLLEDGRQREIPVARIRPGDRLLVRPGERIPVDGELRKGMTAVDESSVTGEPIPQEKAAGSTVYAGTLNQTGVIEVEASRVGEDTTLGKVVRLVGEAERHKPEAVRLIDRYARWFTPAILACAAIAWAWTGDVSRGITVLIVGCPCALILAAPTAIVASIARAARAGILVKGGQFLEEVGRAHAVLFDKTGTLTEGEPRVSEVLAVEGQSQREILTLAACVEQHSTHPLARAVLHAAAEEGIGLCRVEEGFTEVGVGVRARVQGRLVEVRNGARYDALPPPLETRMAELREQGAAGLVVVRDGQPIGLIGVIDRVRPEAQPTVQRLRSLGVERIGILSGDHERSARLVAEFVGVTDAWSDLKPEDKLNRTREIQAEENSVVFVGDGINDAPALAAANVGIAMGAAGTHVALETADIALMNDDVTRIPFVMELSRKMRRRIQWNIAIGMAFNVLAVLAGGAGLFSPIVGAIVHNVGSVVVVLSSASLAFVAENERPVKGSPTGRPMHGPSAAVAVR